MTTREPGQHPRGQHQPDRYPPGEKPERSAEDVMWGRVERRREKIRAQVSDARNGNHKIPTWVMATALGLVLLGWLYLVFFG